MKISILTIKINYLPKAIFMLLLCNTDYIYISKYSLFLIVVKLVRVFCNFYFQIFNFSVPNLEMKDMMVCMFA